MAQPRYRFCDAELRVMTEAAVHARVATAQAIFLAVQANQRAKEASSMAIIAAETVDT